MRPPTTLLARSVLILIAWCCLVGLGVAEAALFHARQPTGVGNVWQGMHNLIDALTLPGLVARSLLARLVEMGGVTRSIVQHTIGWGVWALLALAVLLLGRVLSPCSRRPATDNPTFSRRQALARGALGTVSLCAAGTGTHALAVAPLTPVVRRYTRTIAGLAPGLNGLRILIIADTHVGPRINASFIRASVERGLREKPDLVLLLGDYIHQGPKYAHESIACFAPIVKAGLPVVAVLGNHDHYGAELDVRAALAAHAITLLDNDRRFFCAQSRTLSAVPTRECLCVAGVGDLMEGVVRPDRALRDCPRDVPRLLLSHNPDLAEEWAQRTKSLDARDARIDLMLSGHTHGGQVSLPFLGPRIVPSRYGRKYAGGMVDGPDFPVLISRGLGVSLLAVRFRCPPELVVLALSRAR